MAGTRAMNGDASRATMAIRRMAERQPGSAIAARAPSAMRCTILIGPACPRGLGSRTIISATTTAPKDAALIPNTRA